MKWCVLKFCAYCQAQRVLVLPSSDTVHLSANNTGKVPQPRVGQYPYTQLSKVDDINNFKTYLLYTHESLKMAQVRNTNHVFPYIQKLRCCSHHWTPHTFWQESSNSYAPQTGFHSHYDSTVWHQITLDTQKLHGHKSTMHPEITCYTWKQRGITFQLTHMCNRIGWRWMVYLMPQPLIPRERAHWAGSWVALQSVNIFLEIHKSLAPPRIPIPDHPAPKLVTTVTTLSWLLKKMKK